MYLPSSIKLKHYLLIGLLAIVVLLPVHTLIKNVFLFISRQQHSLSKIPYQHVIDNLKKENLQLRLQLSEYESLQDENERLRTVLALTTAENITLIGAEIISFSPTNWRRFAVLNKGKNEGVHKGYFAIDEKGTLLGKIVETDQHISRLVFVDDPDFTVSVFAGEHGYGLLQGNLVGAKLLYIEDGEYLKKGDTVWMRIPALKSPINVGTIKNVRKDEDSLFWDIDVSLITTNTFIDKVFLVQ